MRGAVLFTLCLLVALGVRLPLAPKRLYNEDSVTFARAVERYDPRHLYPQPPGYPLFVLQAKILRALTGTVERAFFVGVVLGTALALFFLILLTRDVLGAIPGSRRAEFLAAGLLLINPIFLFTGMTSPIRVYLAAVSTIVAWCCWRAWNGDARFAYAASVALGAGSGYRPELLALLGPLWAMSAWRSKRLIKAGLLLAAIAAVWIGFLLARFPDLHAFHETFSKYLSDQSRDYSPIFGAAEAGWIRMLFRVIVWNGTAIFGWIALAPLARIKMKPGTTAFLALWVLPSIAFHALIHVEDPDQTLSTIPAFCILGGAVIASFIQRHRDAALLGLASAAVANLALFIAPFPLSPRPSIYKPAVDALWQTSYEETMNVRARTDAVLATLAPFARDDRAVVLWNRSQVTWRTLSYYYPNLTFCLLMDDRHTGTRPHAAFWRNLELRERYFGEPALVPLGDATQLIWILGRLSPVRAAIAGKLEPLADPVWRSPPAPLDVPGYRIVW